jgi:iron complex transport system ATP-binding protein
MELAPMIEVKDLHFAYKKHKVLEGIDLSLFRGEVVSLLGPNGCGKSTLIRLILKLLDGEDKIRIAGRSLREYSHKEIAAHIAYIPQYTMSLLAIRYWRWW